MQTEKSDKLTGGSRELLAVSGERLCLDKLLAVSYELLARLLVEEGKLSAVSFIPY